MSSWKHISTGQLDESSTQVFRITLSTQVAEVSKIRLGLILHQWLLWLHLLWSFMYTVAIEMSATQWIGRGLCSPTRISTLSLLYNLLNDVIAVRLRLMEYLDWTPMGLMISSTVIQIHTCMLRDKSAKYIIENEMELTKSRGSGDEEQECLPQKNFLSSANPQIMSSCDVCCYPISSEYRS